MRQDVVTIHDHLTGRRLETVFAVAPQSHPIPEALVRRAFDAHFGFGPFQMLLWQPDGVNTEGHASGMRVTIERRDAA